MLFRKYSHEEDMARYRKTLWRVFYNNGQFSILLNKTNALTMLEIFEDAEYIEKIYGWFKGKRIYK